MNQRPSQSYELARLVRNLEQLDRYPGLPCGWKPPAKPPGRGKERALLVAVLVAWVAVAFVLAAAAVAFWPHPH